MNFKAGTLLQDGRYVIDVALGHGYFGTTYRAMHANLVQPVVIKTLDDVLREGDRYEDFKCQFIEQARCLAKCPSPHLPRLLDIFEEDDRPFIVMDYVPGSTLSQLVQGGRPLPVGRTLSYIRQIGTALMAIHAEGLLHRDIQPDHAIRQFGTDCITTIEIGLTRDFTDGINQTHCGLLASGYAAPEQYNLNAPRTVATDVYSLAAVLYFLLTAQTPIAAPLRDRVPMPSVRTLNPEVSPELEAAIESGLAIDPERRPASVDAFLSNLPEFVSSASSSPKPKSSPSLGLPPFARPWVPALFAATSVISALSGAGSIMLLRASNAQMGSDPYQILKTSPEFEAFRKSPEGGFFENRTTPESTVDRDAATDYDREVNLESSDWNTPEASPPTQTYDTPYVNSQEQAPTYIQDRESWTPTPAAPAANEGDAGNSGNSNLNPNLGTSYPSGLEATPETFDPRIEFEEPEPQAAPIEPQSPQKETPQETIPLRSLEEKSLVHSRPHSLG
ncbi:MAG: serine/threonine protein kinase [Oscillatoriales cyanobacterium]|nr:MAG: serine/threonine protein kinase [Oscillatoriales cyanobacterium]